MCLIIDAIRRLSLQCVNQLSTSSRWNIRL